MGGAEVGLRERSGLPADLRGWAAGHGLEALGSGNASGYTSVLPGDPERQFDVARGTTVSGRDVCLWRGCDDTGRPVTCAAAVVPEAALLPPFSSRRGGPGDPGDGTGRIVAGWLAGPVAAGLRQDRVRLSSAYGLLLLRRDGHAAADAMDRLLRQVDEAARDLAAACAPLHRPAAFATALPGALWPAREESAGRAWPPSPLLEEVHRLGRRWAMALEDPRAYHRALPTVPVPGTAWAVVRGVLPGSSTPARIALHTEAPLPGGSGRTALLLAAGAAAPTAPGGVRLEGAPVPLRYAVHGGVLAVWVMRHRDRGLGDVDALVEHGVPLARRLGVPAD